MLLLACVCFIANIAAAQTSSLQKISAYPSPVFAGGTLTIKVAVPICSDCAKDVTIELSNMLGQRTSVGFAITPDGNLISTIPDKLPAGRYLICYAQKMSMEKFETKIWLTIQ